jgi:hypothetical protein
MSEGTFTTRMPTGQLQAYPYKRQIESMEISLRDGDVISVSQLDAAKLRGDLKRPRDQVWVIDGKNVCVVYARSFKAAAGFRCPSK